ncbi:MAG: ectoine synthase [Pseudohongiellaceae bacterium]
MIVREYDQCHQSQRRVKTDNWESTRMLLQGDNMGFSFHITTIYKGTVTPMHYRHHLESVYCIKGEGEVTSVEDGKTYQIKPGTLYILDKHDKHVLTCREELVLACVFNPPVVGNEVHDKTGAYPEAGIPAEENTNTPVREQA